MSEQADRRNLVQSVSRALAVLECFSPDETSLSVAQIAKYTGLNKSTCHRLIATMEDEGWITRAGRGTYRLTLRMLRVGAAALGGQDIRNDAHPILTRLVADFGDTGYLMVPDGVRAVCLDKVEGAFPVQVNFVQVGSSLPLNAGAAPLAILAWRDDLLDELTSGGLPSFTASTTVEEAELRERLAETRRLGYSLSRDDVIPLVAAVGAPVRDNTGTVVAALSLGGLAERFEGSRVIEVCDAVVQAARDLSDRLGHAV